MFSSLLRGSPRVVLLRAALMIAADRSCRLENQGNVPLGFLYLFPMLLVGSAVRRWQIATAATVCTVLTEAFDIFEWSAESGIPRDILYFAAFFCMGLFVYEVGRSRKLAMQHLHQIESQIEARRDAEEQLKVLVESSPAAIFTTDAEGVVLLANNAAHRLFAVPPGLCPGEAIRRYLPSLVNVPALEREPAAFPHGDAVPRAAARRRSVSGGHLVFDLSHERRIAFGGHGGGCIGGTAHAGRSEPAPVTDRVAHPGRARFRMRSATSAEPLPWCIKTWRGMWALSQNKDFEALGTLILALEKIAAMELRQTANQASHVDLSSLLEELRIVIELALRQNGVEVEWQMEPGLPPVWADRQSLMQVFLNLTKNSERAVSQRSVRKLMITAGTVSGRVLVRFRDTGAGVSNPERLFRPFQAGAHATGLGLYLSREFMRTFRGDLRFEPEPDGASFIVDLSPALPDHVEGSYEPADPASVSGRSQLVPGEPQPASPGRA